MKNFAEAECRMFWSAATDLYQAQREGRDLTDYLDEIETVRDYTNQPALKARCRDLLASFQRDPDHGAASG